MEDARTARAAAVIAILRALGDPRAMATSGYAARFNRVLDHVGEHLEGDLTLDALAEIAGLSKFHFHRLFQGHTGETVGGHVRRVRVERAASLMRASTRSLTDIALEVGFPALSDLSRAFKAMYGVPPSAWDRASPLQDSNEAAARLSDAELAVQGRGLQVTPAQLPRSLFVFERVFDPYRNRRLVDAYHAVHGWVSSIDRMDAVFAGMSLDDPAVTPIERCRYDLGVVFPFAATGLVTTLGQARGTPVRPTPPPPAVIDASGLSARRFPALELATVRVRGDLADVGVAWQWLYRAYLPAQPRLPAHHPAMELFVRLPEEIGWEQFDLFSCVPLA